MSEWVKYLLSDVVICLDGQRIPIKKQDRKSMQGNIPYYGASGVIDYVDDYIFNDDLILLGEDGENVVSRNLPLAFKISGKTWVNNHAHVLKVKDNFDLDFVLYLLENRDYKDIISGSAQPKINQKNLMSLAFNLPQQTKQQKIAKILLTCDDVIAKTELAIEKYQAIKQGMMNDLFTRGIDVNTGKLRPSYDAQPELYKQSELGWIPKDWEVKQISQLCDNLDGKRVPIKKEDRELMQGNIPYYGASGIIDFVNNYIFDEDLILLGEDGENVISRNLPLAFKISGKTWVNNHAHVLKPLTNYDIDYLVDILEHQNYMDIISGSAQPKINQINLNKKLVAVAEIEEQKFIKQSLYSITIKIKSENSTLRKYLKIKAGLMQDLLTGKVEVSV